MARRPRGAPPAALSCRRALSWSIFACSLARSSWRVVPPSAASPESCGKKSPPGGRRGKPKRGKNRKATGRDTGAKANWQTRRQRHTALYTHTGYDAVEKTEQIHQTGDAPRPLREERCRAALDRFGGNK
eukprot:GHVT01040750.1.p3 GENE.GHVT01040750.1~~GHVT01040750.1.p3  ORF type:complete len:130 (+),score=28.35 GHVT01040750.1:404-793(+)